MPTYFSGLREKVDIAKKRMSECQGQWTLVTLNNVRVPPLSRYFMFRGSLFHQHIFQDNKRKWTCQEYNESVPVRKDTCNCNQRSFSIWRGRTYTNPIIPTYFSRLQERVDVAKNRMSECQGKGTLVIVNNVHFPPFPCCFMFMGRVDSHTQLYKHIFQDSERQWSLPRRE